jgi:tetratricopeptide (TPR) repeat protein
MYFPKINRLLVLFLCSFLSLFHSSCNQKRNKEKSQDIILRGDDGIKNKYAGAKFEQGLDFWEKKNYQEAKKCFFLADSAYPESPVIVNALANSLARTGFPHMAGDYFDQTLAKDSAYPATYINYGCLLNSMQEYKKAREIFLLGIAKKKCSEFERRILFINLASTYCGLNQKRTALNLLSKAKKGLVPGDLYEKITAFEKAIAEAK